MRVASTSENSFVQIWYGWNVRADRPAAVGTVMADPVLAPPRSDLAQHELPCPCVGQRRSQVRKTGSHRYSRSTSPSFRNPLHCGNFLVLFHLSRSRITRRRTGSYPATVPVTVIVAMGSTRGGVEMLETDLLAPAPVSDHQSCSCKCVPTIRLKRCSPRFKESSASRRW